MDIRGEDKCIQLDVRGSGSKQHSVPFEMVEPVIKTRYGPYLQLTVYRTVAFRIPR